VVLTRRVGYERELLYEYNVDRTPIPGFRPQADVTTE
jgi:hypothetical protein